VTTKATIDALYNLLGKPRGADMHAALVEDFSRPPRYGETAFPVANEGEVVVKVRAAALSNLVRSQANGSHYSSPAQLPFTPGNDGVGVVGADNERVYFMSPRMPYGSMAEYTVVSEDMTIPVPANIDDVDAAALGNPGLATWGPLLCRANLQAGESVLINGATGTAGRQAIQVAKYLGASKIIATGRNEGALGELGALGADETISLRQPQDALLRSFRSVLAEVQVVLDFLWGASAELILKAAAGHGSPVGVSRIRFVQVGSISSGVIALPASVLRSSGVELLGSGLGSLSSQQILQSLRAMFAAASAVQFAIDVEPVPLARIEETWMRQGDRRIVFIP
jgi:NADPH:quinone reductase-like Zn-dependent oxidoreductase